MFCSKCGKQVEEAARFCAGCGQPVAQASTPPVSAPAPVVQVHPTPSAPAVAPPSQSRQSPAEQYRDKVLLLLSLVAVLFVVGGAFAPIPALCLGPLVIIAGVASIAVNKIRAAVGRILKQHTIAIPVWLPGTIMLAVGCVATVVAGVTISERMAASSAASRAQVDQQERFTQSVEAARQYASQPDGQTEAIRAYGEAEKLGPLNDQDAATYLMVLVSLGDDLTRKFRFAEAVASYDAALARNPTSAEVKAKRDAARAQELVVTAVDSLGKAGACQLQDQKNLVCSNLSLEAGSALRLADRSFEQAFRLRPDFKLAMQFHTTVKETLAKIDRTPQAILAKKEATRAAALEKKETERLERERKKADREKMAATAVEIACGPSPTIHDMKAATFLRERATFDPDSIEVDNCTTPQLTKKACWLTSCEVRGKNAFGVIVRSHYRFSVGRNERILGAEPVE